MREKTVVITGATSGIGAVAAQALARQGVRIVFIARDRSRGETTLAKLQSISRAEHRVHYADLSRIGEMKRVAGEIAASLSTIDVLINNAGILINSRRSTEEGLELTFATNHLAYFVLTHLLRDRFSPDARIVNTASRAHARGTLDFNDLQSVKHYDGMKAYCMTKLCNVLFTRELARRLQHTRITANCLSPGFVATRWGDASGGMTGLALKIAKLFALTPEQGTRTMIYLSTANELASVTGGYFHECRSVQPSADAQNEELAQRLWEVSAKLTGIDSM